MNRSDQRVALLPTTIALETVSLHPSSWQRMYCRTRETDEHEREFTCHMSVEINAWTVVNPNAKKAHDPDDDDGYEFYELGGWEMNPSRVVMKKVEAEALGECGIRFDWAATRLHVYGRPMSYRMWKKMSRLADGEGVRSWYNLSLWKNGGPFPPSEQMIDDALKAYEPNLHVAANHATGEAVNPHWNGA